MFQADSTSTLPRGNRYPSQNEQKKLKHKIVRKCMAIGHLKKVTVLLKFIEDESFYILRGKED